LKKVRHNKQKTHTPDGFKVCFVTKESYPREEMIRFAYAPNHDVIFDETGKLPGRGMWVHPARETVQYAVTKRVFSKSFHTAVKTPTDLMDQVEAGLKRRTLSLLGLARKGGAVVFGFEAVKKAVMDGSAIFAFEATDASEREQDKLYHYVPDLPVCSHFTREELGRMMGQTAVVHIGILNQKAAVSLIATAKKLNLFMQGKQKG